MFQDLSLLKVYTGKNKQDMIYDYIKEGVERDKEKFGVSWNQTKEGCVKTLAQPYLPQISITKK